MNFDFEDATPVNSENVQADETWKYQEAKEGDSVEGLLVNTKKNIGPNDNNVYTIEDKDGKLIDVWGCAVINNHLASLEPKKWGVKLVYDGKKTPEKGGRDYHSFTIYKLPVAEADADDVPNPEDVGQ